ncbi:MAG: FAD-dependent oxidoreductase [Clostridiales Family XIII bacterium]|jgi:2,4-dienoyl-CoA reductase-like NADH-dependent reductase (Old Yellow Enzyme family)/thioredoxin reductase|nr:FAD-dependent oxidoreductase [Clostridiales Family XIII bacterium]
MNQYPHLFRPLTVKKTVYRNRIFSLPNKGKPAHSDGTPSDLFIEYLATKARGGAAQVTVGDTSVDPEYARGRWAPLNTSKENYGFLNEAAFAIQQYGAVASIELNHSGSHANPPGKNPVGPVSYRREDGVHVDAVDDSMMKRIAERFAGCALDIKTIGFNAVLLHGGHGWLLGEFLSPKTNVRTDQFGGTLENRARFPMMVVDAVRAAVGSDFPIEYRISGAELLDGGLTIEESSAFIRMIEDRIDLVNVSGGVDTYPQWAVHVQPTIFLPNGYHVKWAERIKQEVSIPVIALGGINTPELAEQILSEGKADVIGMSRAILADPNFPKKVLEHKSDDIDICIRCMSCLEDASVKRVIGCAVNPGVGREARLSMEYAVKPQPKKVLVIGGGIAGMKAAVTAAARGHDVTLAEQRSELGGIMKFTDNDTLKIDLRNYKNHLIAQMMNANIELLLNMPITKDNAAEYDADAILVATGSEPVSLSVTGWDLPHVMHVLDAYNRIDTLGNRIVIIGGGLAGCETAVELARRGHHVTIVEVMQGFARDANHFVAEALRQALEATGVTCLDRTVCSQITDADVYLEIENAEARILPADHVLYAIGMRSRNALLAHLPDDAGAVIPIGDCVRPRRVNEAVFDGYFAAMNL